jgi:hypothetical protein
VHLDDELVEGVQVIALVARLGAVLTSDAVIEQVRKELRRQTGHNVETGELRELLVSSVLRPECL